MALQRKRSVFSGNTPGFTPETLLTTVGTDDILRTIIEEDFVVDRSNRAIIIALALGHGVIDLYANFLAGLLPFFKRKFSLTNSLSGALISVMIFSASLCQVFYAYVGDKWGRRFFVVVGPVVTGLFMCFIGLSPSFTVLLILLMMGGMGVAAFHPHAASFVGASSGEKRGLGLSIFMTVGTGGFAFGPLISTALISSPAIGPARMPLFSVAGLVMSFFIYRYSDLSGEGLGARSSANVLSVIKPHARPLTLLCMIVILRATVCIVFTNFMSLLMEQRGLALVIGGRAITLFLISITAGTMLGGYLYDRVSRKRLLIFSLLFSSPFLFILLYAHGFTFAILLIIAGVSIGCSHPVPLAISQELVPEGASTVSSIMMGFSWGLAGFSAWFFGRLSDSYGGNVVPSMSIAALLPLLAVVLVFLLPQEQR